MNFGTVSEMKILVELQIHSLMGAKMVRVKREVEAQGRAQHVFRLKL
jgi:hypothetical protein